MFWHEGKEPNPHEFPFTGHNRLTELEFGRSKYQGEEQGASGDEPGHGCVSITLRTICGPRSGHPAGRGRRGVQRCAVGCWDGLGGCSEGRRGPKEKALLRYHPTGIGATGNLRRRSAVFDLGESPQRRLPSAKSRKISHWPYERCGGGSYGIGKFFP